MRDDTEKDEKRQEFTTPRKHSGKNLVRKEYIFKCMRGSSEGLNATNDSLKIFTTLPPSPIRLAWKMFPLKICENLVSDCNLREPYRQEAVPS